MTLRAGYGVADITPPEGGDLNGFAARRQPATGVAAPLEVRVVVLARGRRRAAIAACDALGFTVADSHGLEQCVAAAAGAAPGNVLLACTHTHAGAMSMPLGLVGRFDPGYLHRVGRRLAAAATAAAAEMRPVTAATHGRHSIASLGAFRCATHEPGRDAWPGELQALQLRREDGPPVTLAHVGIHPYVLGWQNRRFHPDYPGAARDAIERRCGGPALVLPGCAADIAPQPGLTRSLRSVARFGDTVAEAAAAAIANGEPMAADCLRPALRRARARFGFFREAIHDNDAEAAMAALSRAGDRALQNRREWQEALDTRRLPTTSPFPIRVLRLGRLVFAGMPAELFHDTGADLARAFPRLHLWPLAHTGGNLGYLPRPFAYRNLTYEAAYAYEWYRTAGALLPDMEPRFRAAAASAIKSVTADIGGSSGGVI